MNNAPITVQDQNALKSIISNKLTKIATIQGITSSIIEKLNSQIDSLSFDQSSRLLELMENVSKNNEDFLLKFLEMASRNSILERLLSTSVDKIDSEETYTVEYLPDANKKAIMQLANTVINSRIV